MKFSSWNTLFFLLSFFYIRNTGVMFDVQIKNTLPLNFLEISSVWVRGGLGPVAVYWYVLVP